MLSSQAAILLGVIFFLVAILYASVGHGGASGYLAAMALFGLAPSAMKPAALVLNVLVASLATYKFLRAGCFSWRIFWPFALFSIPLAYVTGSMALPGTLFKPLVGLVLLFASGQMWVHKVRMAEATTRPVPFALSGLAGMGIGALSGFTGVGGGIFLSPLLLSAGWTGARQASGIAAAFILVNSVAALGGLNAEISSLPTYVWAWGVCALGGGWIGAELGSRQGQSQTILRALAVVLLIAGLKMVLA